MLEVMSVKVLYATSKKGKFLEVERRFKRYGLELVLPRDLNIEMEVPEVGRTLEANAAIKVRAYRERLRVVASETRKDKSLDKSEVTEGTEYEDDSYLVMADDTGLSIDALGREPGAKVRRWRDGATVMTDEEIVEYCLEQMREVPPEARTADWRCVMAVLFPTTVSKLPTSVKTTAGRPVSSFKASLESNILYQDKQDPVGDYEIEYFSGSLRGVLLTEPKGEMTPGTPLDFLFYIPEWEMTLQEVKALPETEREKYLTYRDIAVDKSLERILEYSATVNE